MGVASSCCESCFRSRSSSYEPLLLENEREAVADLLQFLENRTTTDFFRDSPLAALTTLSFSDNVDLQRSAALAFAEITEKEVRPVGRDTLDPILFLLTSHDTEVQRAASAALGNLAVNTDNKLLIVKLGGLEPLIRQMLSPNVEVQCNAVGCVTNLATHAHNRKKLAQTEHKLVSSLVQLMDSPSLKVQCQAALALRNLASDEKYQLEIVKADGLTSLLRLLQSTYLPLILSAAACVRNVSIHPQNESPIIESGFLQPLINLLSFKDNEEVQCHAISTLRNLAASSEKNKQAIVKAGAVQSIKELVLEVPMNVQSEMTACIAVLALSDELKGQLLEMGICEVLIPLTNSGSSEVQGNSAAALGNLSSKDGRTTSDDYSAFNDVWDKPDGGMHRYLYRFLTSADATFQHIAVWTIVQLLESGDPQLVSNIRNSSLLIPNIRSLAETRTSTPASSLGGTPHSHHSQAHSYQDTETGNGHGEIQMLARRILDFTDSEGVMTPSALASQLQASSLSQRDESVSGRDHEELRKSVREAFAGPAH
uniref:Vacuolar protein 8 n=1 Tax=Ganoderma boninense TaxID=34458 RepID=A0A5K1K531_9APHY|nr:ATP-dependent RNA helicase VAD1 (EC (Virulence-associated DEAD box protein 1) [Ganoderma boninense]